MNHHNARWKWASVCALALVCHTAGAQQAKPPKVDFSQALGITPAQAEQVKTILHEAHEYGQSREATRSQLSAVLNDAQLKQLHETLQARRTAKGGRCAPARSGS